jgi:oligopeptide transport system substrate-binding protein
MCAQAASVPAVPNKTITIKIPDAPVAFDWNTQSTLTDAHIIMNTQAGLFRHHPINGKLISHFCESVHRSKDGKTLTFKLKKKILWSDGQAITAEDFRYAWLRALSTQSNSIYTYYFFNIENAEAFSKSTSVLAETVGIEARDAQTLMVRLIRPDPTWEIRTAFWPFFPARKDLIEKHGNAWISPGIMPSSGDFLFDRYETGKRSILKSNPLAFRTPDVSRGNLQQVEFEYGSNYSDTLTRYEKKQLHVVTGIPPEEQIKIQGRKDRIEIPMLRVITFVWNTQRFPMNLQSFRKACLRSIRQENLIPKNAISLKSTTSLIPRPLLASQRVRPVTDLVSARALLKSSGVIINDKLKLRFISGPREPYLGLTTAIESQLQKAFGLNIQTQVESGSNFDSLLQLSEYAGVVLTWTAKIKTPEDFLQPYTGTASQVRSHFQSHELDAIMDLASQATNPLEKERLLLKAQKILIDDEAVLFPIAIDRPPALVRPEVAQLYFNHMGVPEVSAVRLQ